MDFEIRNECYKCLKIDPPQLRTFTFFSVRKNNCGKNLKGSHIDNREGSTPLTHAEGWTLGFLRIKTLLPHSGISNTEHDGPDESLTK